MIDEDEGGTWLDACRRFARTHRIDARIVELLGAFVSPNPRGGPPPPAEAPWPGEFPTLEDALLEDDDVLRVAADLRHEVDADQAEMFERRVMAVDGFLASFADPTARLSRVGLRYRLAGIMAASRPRTTRVRALADFYYSHASRHHHARRGGVRRSLDETVSSAKWEAVARGLERATLEALLPEGPMHVNVLRADPRHISIRAADCRRLAARGVAFADQVQRSGAVAATSGGFFLYSESDIEPPSVRHDPVGLLMEDGRVVSPPVFRRGAVLVTDDGRVVIEALGPVGIRLELPEREQAWIVVEGINRAHARRGPDGPSIAIVGSRVVGVGHALPVPLNGLVTPRPAGIRVEVGDIVRWGPVRVSDGSIVRNGIAGGPVLVAGRRPALDLRAEDFWGTAPPVTFSQDETGDHNLLPRLAAGLDERGRLLLVAVDGRNIDRALGMTLSDVAGLMIALGCHTATNLDGGSSKRMVVEGRTLDLPTTEIVADPSGDAPIRPVYSALLLFEGI